MRDHLDIGIEGLDGAAGRVDFRLTRLRSRVENLTLQIGHIHYVVVDDA